MFEIHAHVDKENYLVKFKPDHQSSHFRVKTSDFGNAIVFALFNVGIGKVCQHFGLVYPMKSRKMIRCNHP